MLSVQLRKVIDRHNVHKVIFKGLQKAGGGGEGDEGKEEGGREEGKIRPSVEKHLV